MGSLLSSSRSHEPSSITAIGPRQTMKTVAVVEDHDRLRRLIMKEFASADLLADSFSHIEPAWLALQTGGYAAAIIDRCLPDGDGLDLVRHLRAAGWATPCLVLTGRDTLHDRVAGLEAGADDYLSKPFAMMELVARTRAMIRRPFLAVGWSSSVL
jgi:DNA-binding response OmpR family regulator